MAENAVIEDSEKYSNVKNEWWIITLFYIIASIILVGSIFQLMLIIPALDKFYILFIKKFPFLHTIGLSLRVLSIIFFPVACFYIFTTLYTYVHRTLF
ncbi:hypothetical protein Yalta_050 [Yalta virus]|nr:hypothetical protein Yalta_050 [Yalta virus]